MGLMWSAPASAHQIPPELLQFLAENPEATETEIEAFLETIFPDNDFESFEDDLALLNENSLPDPLLEFLMENQTTNQESINEFLTFHPEIADQSLLVFQNIYPELFEEKIPGKTSNPFWNNARNFVRLGVEHILGGADHVLFVLSLILVWIPLRKLLLIITTFTVAHSVTLLLAGTNTLTLSSQITEPIIALSIIYVAMMNAFFSEKFSGKNIRNVLATVFAFGLFHGLGFAGVFAHIAIDAEFKLSSLLFFNVGVEVGQIMILAVGVPALFFLRKFRHSDTFIKAFAFGISLLAFSWFLERI